MRKRILSVALVAAALSAGSAFAAPGPTDQNNNNLFGLCTAYFNGSQNGQAHKRNAPPFQGLEAYVGTHDGIDNDGDNRIDESDEKGSPTDVWNYCQANGGVGGQPDNPNTTTNDGNGRNARGKG